MALIQCPDCESQVSDQAATCPRCARPLASATSPLPQQHAANVEMSAQRIGILLCALVGMVATFLPWASIGFISVAGTDGDGWITFGLFVLPLAFAVTGDRSSNFKMATRLATLGIGALIVAFAIWKISEIRKGAPIDDTKIALSVGVGLYLAAVAGMALVLAPIWMMPTTAKSKGALPESDQRS